MAQARRRARYLGGTACTGGDGGARRTRQPDARCGKCHGVDGIEDVFADIRYAFRNSAGSGAFTHLSFSILALGIALSASRYLVWPMVFLSGRSGITTRSTRSASLLRRFRSGSRLCSRPLSRRALPHKSIRPTPCVRNKPLAVCRGTTKAAPQKSRYRQEASDS